LGVVAWCGYLASIFFLLFFFLALLFLGVVPCSLLILKNKQTNVMQIDLKICCCCCSLSFLIL